MTTKPTTLYFGPVNVDLDAKSASVDLPGGGAVKVSSEGAEVTVPGGGQVTFGPGGGAVDVPGVGRLEVRSDGFVQLPDGTLWNSWGSRSPDVVITPGAPAPIPIPQPIPIPVPRFVIERFDVPISLPTFTPHSVEWPVPVPRVQLTPFDLPWPSPTLPPGRPLAPPSPDLPDLLPSLGPAAPHVTDIKAAFAKAVDLWMPSARVTRGVVNGPIGVVPPGALSSKVDFKAAARDAAAKAGVPATPYFALIDALADEWTGWFAGFSTVVSFPAFAMWPGDTTPPVPAIPQPLSVGSSNGRTTVSAAVLYAAAAGAFDSTAAASELENAVRQLSLWYATRFASFGMTTILTNVLGRGPVPTYAPPAVDAGPVIGGTIMMSRGVLAGPNPFRVP